MMGKMIEKPVVLVTAVGAAPGLNSLRAIRDDGRFSLVAADADRYSPGLYERDVDGVILPLATDEESYIRSLKKIIVEKKISVLIPCIEEEVFAIARHAADLKTTGVNFLLPDLAVLSQAADKGMATMTAGRHGIPCPKSLVISREQDFAETKRAVEAFALQCPAPWILKPTIGRGMRGVSHAGSIDRVMTILEDQSRDFILQEFIPAPVGNMHIVGLLFGKEGDVVRQFSSRSFRTMYPGGGPATGGISIYVPEIIEQTRQLLSLIGPWRGPLMVEWLRDPRDSRFKFIEINPRLWGYNSLAVGSGLNFPVAVVDLCLGNEITTDPGFKQGVIMLRTTCDLIFQESPFELDG
jgi:predicted ATP-grasp superfamily ATP-dependent carboligase